MAMFVLLAIIRVSKVNCGVTNFFFVMGTAQNFDSKLTIYARAFVIVISNARIV